jgi:hypothetical protein
MPMLFWLPWIFISVFFEMALAPAKSTPKPICFEQPTPPVSPSSIPR